MKLKIILILLTFTVLSSIFSASYEWELKDAIAKSMEDNLYLKQKQIDLNLKQVESDRSWNLLLPDLNADLGLGKVISNDFDPWTISGSLGISLTLKASLPYQFRDLQYQLDMELISYERFKQVYVRDIKDFFYQILLVKEKISIAKENLRLMNLQYEKTNLLYEAGLASDLDLMAMKVSIANFKPEILSLENEYASKIFQLKYLTGIKPEDELSLIGHIYLPDDIPSFSNLSGFIAKSLDLQSLLKETKIIENDRKMTLLQTWDPAFNFGYSYSPELAIPLKNDFLSSDTWFARGALTISMSLPLNTLLPGSANKVNLEAIDARFKKNQLAIDQLNYTSSMELSNLINRLEGISQTLDARILAAEFSREAYDYTVSLYNSGGVDLLDLQGAESDLQEARVSVLTETYNYISALLDLEYLLGIEIIKE